MKCLKDKLFNNVERHFCLECFPADPDFIINVLDPKVSGFLNKKGLKILHQNVNGIFEKLQSIKNFLSDSKNAPHIMSFSETHTNSKITNAKLKIPGYTLRRKDRVIETHGGVSIYVRDDLKFVRREDLEVDGCEFLWIEIFVQKSKSFLFCSAYRPPDNSKYLDKNFCQKFDNMLNTISLENKETIMLGDFNCDYKVPRDHVDIKELIKTYGFSQLIKEYTRVTKDSKTCIDLCFTTKESFIADTLTYKNSLSDHSMIGVIRKMNCQKYLSKTIKTRDYSKYNPVELKNELRNLPWEKCLISDYNEGWNLFKHYILSTLNKHCPIKEKRVRGKPSPWLTREIKQLIDAREYHLHQSERTEGAVKDDHWNRYKNLRNSINNKIRTAKANHVRAVFRESRNQPNDFWKQIKKCYPVKDTETTQKSFKIDGRLTSDTKTIANAFCSFFAKVWSSLMTSPIIHYTWKTFDHFKYLKNVNRANSMFAFRPVYTPDILKILLATKSSKATGSDQIPAKIIKDIAHEIAAPLTFLINRSLQTGIFPTAEKIAKINPVYKSGDHADIDNYRPISVLNILSKVVERVAYNQLSDYLESNNLLNENQFGFRRKRSTRDAVTKFTDHTRENMDKSKVTGALFMDLRKAFDTVNHGCLLSKLPYYGITGKEVNWFSSYLFLRSQFVSIDGIASNSEFVTHGVPQGSILGPLLFVLLINDLPLQSMNCKVLMYADDTVIYFSHKSIPEIEKCINSDAHRIHHWMRENCLILNPKKGKTEFVLFASRVRPDTATITIDNNVINQPDQYEYLGIQLDSHLNLNDHLQSMYKRVSSRLNMLRKIRHQISPSVAEVIFNAMIQPLVFYCYPVFSCMSNTWSDKFESLFYRAKMVVNSRKKWPTFQTRLRRKIVLDVFKSISAGNSCYEFIKHKKETRNRNCLLRLPQIKSEAGRKMSYYKGAYIFNSLSAKIREEKSLVLFRNLVNEFEFKT